jgi:hypothetical protein
MLTSWYSADSTANGIADYEEWLRYTTTIAVETEINVQLGRYALHRQSMELVPHKIMEKPDFAAIFGTEAQDFGE